MVLSVLYGKKYNKAQVGSIELDVTLRENHRFSSRTTNYPIEEGSTLSDHIINEPTTVNLSALVSDTPLNILSFYNRSIDVFNKLIDLHNKREPVTLVTGLKTYANMVITLLEIPRELRTGQSLTFNIELQQIILDNSIRLISNEQNLFGGVQTKIPRDIVSQGEDIPFIQNDPTNSLKDQATSGTDYGIQNLATPITDVLDRINQSKEIILGN